MLFDFFLALRRAGVPASLTEFLALLEGLDRHLAGFEVERFYYLARMTLVKDERFYDRFDRAFGEYFDGVRARAGAVLGPDPREIPEEWLRRQAERLLSEQERRQIEALGWDRLMQTLRERLAEQKGRHQGGSKWIGTAGRSPFGAYGDHPEGVRIGQDGSRRRSAVKVWDRREFRNLDGSAELGTRNIKLALRRLRQFARTGAPTRLDLDGTIGATARNGGMLDIRLEAERHNAVKVLLFLDVGGSMDDHVRTVEELFSAARSEFKHLEYFYFHNCLYESVWRDNRRRRQGGTPTLELMNTYGPDYRVVVVGDASMSPYEISHPGGSVEHFNPEPGAVWLQRLCRTWPRLIWLNPLPRDAWGYTASVGMIRELTGGRMFPLSLEGLEAGIARLRHRA